MDHKDELPSRRSLSRTYLPDLYERKKKQLIETLTHPTVTHCSVTSDLWTSRSTMGFLTVTCHYISADWTMESAVLSTVHVKETHTMENLAAELKMVTDM